jgi:hypothetical protein
MRTVSQQDSKTARRGPGEGTVDVLPSGKHRVRLPTREGRRSTTFTSAEEAEQFRAGAAAILAEAPRAETLGTYGARWLDRRELAGEHRGIATERGLWRTHVAPSDLADPRVATALRARDATGPVRLMLALRLAAAVAHAITTLAAETR